MQRIGMGGKLLLLVVLIMGPASAGLVGQASGPSAGQTAGPAIDQSETAKRFVGTWRLVSVVGGSAELAANTGPHPTGMIIYDSSGHMAAQIMPDRVRPKYAGSQPTPEEARAALLGYIAYFGTYTVDERAQTVTHHREGNIAPGGAKEIVRHYEFAPGDRLILIPMETANPRHLTWERVK